MPELQVSYRQFAKMVGATEGAVRKAVGRGTIVRGVIGNDTANPKILPTVAAQEWGKVIIEPDDDDLDEVNVTDADLKAAETVDMSKGIPDNTSKSEADRIAAVMKARKLRLEALELEGSLVDKGMVYSTLFEFAQSMRDRFINIPDRCIDNVLAAPTRNDAIIVMGDELAAVLKDLATTDNIELIKK